MNLTDIKGVGEKVSQKLNSLGITTIKDLVEFLPSTYIDLGKSVQLDDIAIGDYALVKVEIVKIMPYKKTKNGIGMSQVLGYQDCVKLNITWFNMPYITSKISLGEYYVYGKIVLFNGDYSMTNPIIKGSEKQDEFNSIIPIYPLKELISQATFRKIVTDAIDKVEFQESLGGINLKSNYAIAHTAKDMKNIYRAHYELALHELTRQFCQYREYRSMVFNQTKKPKLAKIDDFIASLPYQLTPSQRQAIEDILADFATDTPMNRLLLGDVGSGKTAVAMCALYANYKCGGQGVLLAPTEVLAEQHYNTLSKALAPFGVKVVKLTASAKGANKAIKDNIASGVADIIVGTHSCFSKDVEYNNLTFAIIDELHKFGVKQRATIVDKGVATDCLVMSATPLPRTLAMVLYGDLKESKLELRDTQTKIRTYVMRDNKLLGLYEYIRKHLDMGEQAYIICPKIEDADGLELSGAKAVYNAIKDSQFKDYAIALLHGRMSGEEKSRVINNFTSGKTQVLVATGLVEVGIDAQKATIIAIMSADNFGLSALHQLRGRVGRGATNGECFLHIATKEIPQRILALKDCNDGIKLAELDAKLRGMGDIIGVKQNGKRGFERYKIKITKAIVMQAKRLADKTTIKVALQKNCNNLDILLN